MEGFDTELSYKHKRATLQKDCTIQEPICIRPSSIGSNATLGIKTLLTTIHDGSSKLCTGKIKRANFPVEQNKFQLKRNEIRQAKSMSYHTNQQHFVLFFFFSKEQTISKATIPIHHKPNIKKGKEVKYFQS